MSKRLLCIIALSSLTTIATSSADPVPPTTSDLIPPAYDIETQVPGSRAWQVLIDTFGCPGYSTQLPGSPWNHQSVETTSVVFACPDLPLKTIAYDDFETGSYEISEERSETYHSKALISAGAYHVLAINSSGKYWSWGWQAFNRLSNGQTSGTAPSPVQLYGGAHPDWESNGLNNNLCVAAGLSHSLMIEGFGKGIGFGSGIYGELGSATASNQYSTSSPICGANAAELSNMIEATAGDHFSGILVTDPTAMASNCQVYTFGTNNKGQLGRPATTQDHIWALPVQTDSIAHDSQGNPVLDSQGNPKHVELSDIEEVEAGSDFCLAHEGTSVIDAYGDPGQVWVWGNNSNGQLGTGNTTNQPYATKAKLDANTVLDSVISISGGETHSVLVRWLGYDENGRLDTEVWSMGSRTNGRLGDGLTAGNALYPVRVVKADGTPLDHIRKVSAGSSHSLALDDEGHVWAWGYNGWGALGDNTTTSRAVAAKVKNPDGTGDLSNIDSISAGGNGYSNFSVAVGTDGTVYTWGINDYGQLGIGTTGGSRRLPQVVPGFSLGN